MERIPQTQEVPHTRRGINSDAEVQDSSEPASHITEAALQDLLATAGARAHNRIQALKSTELSTSTLLAALHGALFEYERADAVLNSAQRQHEGDDTSPFKSGAEQSERFMRARALQEFKLILELAGLVKTLDGQPVSQQRKNANTRVELASTLQGEMTRALLTHANIYPEVAQDVAAAGRRYLGQSFGEFLRAALGVALVAHTYNEHGKEVVIAPPHMDAAEMTDLILIDASILDEEEHADLRALLATPDTSGADIAAFEQKGAVTRVQVKSRGYLPMAYQTLERLLQDVGDPQEATYASFLTRLGVAADSIQPFDYAATLKTDRIPAVFKPDHAPHRLLEVHFDAQRLQGEALTARSLSHAATSRAGGKMEPVMRDRDEAVSFFYANSKRSAGHTQGVMVFVETAMKEGAREKRKPGTVHHRRTA